VANRRNTEAFLQRGRSGAHGGNAKQIHAQPSAPCSSYAQCGLGLPNAVDISGRRINWNTGGVARWKISVRVGHGEEGEKISCHTEAQLRALPRGDCH
jgi:hypothetical protein